MKKLLLLLITLLFLVGCADGIDPIALPPPPEPEGEEIDFYEYLPQGPYPCPAKQ
jgi:hypothetical protein